MGGGMLFLFIKQAKAKRGAALLEKSIKAQADEQQMGQRPDRKGEIEELKNELLAAIESLKKSKLGRGRSGKTALYALPWYMFIGPPAAGKTTAIINSGLEFSYGSDIKGVGGTRNCDWFFSNSTILLDTAGRYTTEDEDREEWNAFLDMLKKYRKRNPINGVLIGMSMTDLLDASVEDIEWHAKNIRQRIDELIQKLGIRFPVYLVFTKCDLIQGFVELYEDLNRKERGQIWGTTFTTEQQNAPNFQELFEKEFHLLTQQLNNMRLKRLSSPTKPENRSKAYVFPIEFASIKDQVGHFIARLFQPSPYKEKPIFRGFYFTSGTQEGVPIDRVIDAISKQFNLPAAMITEPEIEKKSYFIKKLFTDVIIPDQNMAMKTSRAAVSQSLFKKAFIGVLGVLLAAFIVGISIGYARGRIELSKAKKSVVLMEDIDWFSSQDLLSNFERMDQFRAQVVALENKQSSRPLIHLGLYRLDTVLVPARELYYRKIREFVRTHLYQKIEKNLEDYKNGERYFDDQDIREYLRAYLLMGPEIGRLEEYWEEFLIEELTELFPYARDNEELRSLVTRQIEFFVQRLGEEGMPAFESNEFLITYVQNIMYETPSIYGIYDRIRREMPGEYPPYSQFILSSHLGDEDYRDILISEEEVSGFFTQQAWKEYVEKAIQETSQGPITDWLYGDVSVPQDLGEPDQLALELENIYFEEYAESWWRFIRSIRCQTFENLDSASEAMEKLGDPSKSPYITLLKNLTEETKFESAGPLEEVKKADSPLKKAVQNVVPEDEAQSSFLQEKGQQLGSEFSAFHSLVPAEKEGEESADALAVILNKYSEIGAELKTLLENPGLGAKDTAATILQQKEGSLPDTLMTIRNTLSGFDLSKREPAQSLLELPVLNAWIALLNESQSYINSLWKSEIYDEFRGKLANYYPFNRGSTNDAAIMDVETFFNPQSGVFWKFFTEELESFIDRDSLNTFQWEGYGIELSSRTKEAFLKAKDITEALFPQGTLGVRFRLRPELPKYYSKPAPAIERIILNINGEEFLYRMGGIRWQEFSWPTYEGIPFASLQVIIRDMQVNPLRYERDWGWFRLLDSAEEIVQESPLEYKILWVINFQDTDQKYKQVGILFKLRAISTTNPFTEYKDFFNFLCPERLNTYVQ
jgi:type VI secretion system protein ImpL